MKIIISFNYLPDYLLENVHKNNCTLIFSIVTLYSLKQFDSHYIFREKNEILSSFAGSE